MSEEKISEPIGIQSAEVLDWTKSLRDRSNSPVRVSTRSRSPSPARSSARKNTPRKGVIMSEVKQPKSSSRGPKTSQLLKGSGTVTTVARRSTDTAMRRSTGNMAASFNTKVIKNKEADNAIEAEYIKNLQQQIYFLELETNYLREQAKQATDLHPKMTAEAERMLSKLRALQNEMDGLILENKRKGSSVEILNKEKAHLVEKLREEEDARNRDKRMLMDEIVELKKTMAKIESAGSFRDGQLMDARNELEKSAAALKNAETKIITLKSQLEQRIEQHTMTSINLDEKRSELLSAETQLRSLEEKYYNSTVSLHDKVTDDLRAEICELRQRQKEAELSAEQERHLREKVSSDGSVIVRENATMHQQVMELTRQLEREKNLRDEIEERHQSQITETVQVKEREKEMKFEIDYLREQLRKEQDKVRNTQEQVSMKDSVSTQQELQLNTARSRVTELSGMHEMREKENVQLRKDKALLVDHVADIQKKLEAKNEEVVVLRSQLMGVEQRVEELEQVNTLETHSQSQKWGEFERLAESMRSLSHTMAGSKTRSPRGTMQSGTQRPMQY